MKISSLLLTVFVASLSIAAQASDEGKASLARCYSVVNAEWTHMSKQESELLFKIDSMATDPNGVDNRALAKENEKLRSIDSSLAQLKLQARYAEDYDINTDGGFAVMKSFCALHGVDLVK